MRVGVATAMFVLSSIMWAQNLDLERVQALLRSGDLSQARLLLDRAVKGKPHYSRQGLTEKAGRYLRGFEELRQKQEREDQKKRDRVLIIEE